MDMDIQEVARLARLALAPEEAEALAAELTSILTYVDQLDQVDTSEVPPTHHVVSLQTPYREDVRGDVLSREETLQNAPRSDGESFIVPKVI